MPQDDSERFDDAMFAFSQGDYDKAIVKLRALLEQNPAHFDAQLALGMAHYRKGDFESAIAEGLTAEKLRPKEQLVHTNLSLFYMKKGDKQTAEHHGLQARIASWRGGAGVGGVGAGENPELAMAQEKAAPIKITGKVPPMPWKKNKPISSS